MTKPPPVAAAALEEEEGVEVVQGRSPLSAAEAQAPTTAQAGGTSNTRNTRILGGGGGGSSGNGNNGTTTQPHKENETMLVPSSSSLSLEGDNRSEEGQEATLVEEPEDVSPTNKTVLGSLLKSLRRKKSHGRRRVSSSTSIILPPQLASMAALLHTNDVDERRREANQKASYARRLLEAALTSFQAVPATVPSSSSSSLPNEQHPQQADPAKAAAAAAAEFQGMTKIEMIEKAFKYAVEARRLLVMDNEHDDDDDDDDESHSHNDKLIMAEAAAAAAWEDHRALGEAAALEAHHYNLVAASNHDSANAHKERAQHHLECILSCFEKKIKAPDHIILNIDSSQEHHHSICGEQTLSTLGFDNTFEISPTTHDNDAREKYSITSLNELMDNTVASNTVTADSPSHLPMVLDSNAKTHKPLPLPDSPLSGTVESQQKGQAMPQDATAVVEKALLPPRSAMEDVGVVPTTTNHDDDDVNIKKAKQHRKSLRQLVVRMPTGKKSKRSKIHGTTTSDKKNERRAANAAAAAAARGNDGGDNANSSRSSCSDDAISELESIRALEETINTKLKKATQDGDGSFSLVTDEDDGLMEAPKFVSAPSFDPSIMSLENWDNLADGGNSLDDIVKRAEAEKEKKIRKEKHMMTTDDDGGEPHKRVQAAAPSTSKSRVSRLWRSRSEAFAPMKQQSAAVDKRGKAPAHSMALEAHKVRFVGGKKPDVIPPPFVTVTCEERVRSTLDDAIPNYQVQSMSILGLDAAPANDDAFSNTKDKGWKRRILSVRKLTHPPKGSTKRWSKGTKDADSERGVYHGDAKGITTSTDSDVLSWPEMRIRSANSNEVVGLDKYRTLADDVDSAIEKAEKQRLEMEDPIDSGIAMLLNNANPDVVRQVLSADAGKVDVEDSGGKPVDFADVEFEDENKVQTQKALVSRDAVLQNIYADRNSTPVKAPKPLARSSTQGTGPLENHLEPSTSFLEMIEKERAEAEEKKRPKRMSSFFRRNKGKEKVTLLV